jgi:molybdate-binding protein
MASHEFTETIRHVRALRGLTQDEVAGYLEVVAAVQNADADAGVTIRVTADACELGFIRPREPRYDLVIPETETRIGARESNPGRAKLTPLRTVSITA